MHSSATGRLSAAPLLTDLTDLTDLTYLPAESAQLGHREAQRGVGGDVVDDGQARARCECGLDTLKDSTRRCRRRKVCTELDDDGHGSRLSARAVDHLLDRAIADVQREDLGE